MEKAGVSENTEGQKWIQDAGVKKTVTLPEKQPPKSRHDIFDEKTISPAAKEEEKEIAETLNVSHSLCLVADHL